MAADELIEERPVAATVLVAAVATVAYVALQLVMADGVNVAQTAGFVVVFTIVYVGGNWALQQYQSDDAEEAGDPEGGEDATGDAG